MGIFGIGTAVSSALDFGHKLHAGAMNRNQANTNRAFQSYFAHNAHQIEVADLKSAGLNPMLSALGGGAQAMSGAPGVTDGSTGLGQGMAAAGQLAQQRDLIKSQVDKNQSDAALAAEMLITNRTQQEANSAQAARQLAEIGTTSALADAYRAQSMREYSQARLNSAQTYLYGLKGLRESQYTDTMTKHRGWLPDDDGNNRSFSWTNMRALLDAFNPFMDLF